MEHLGGILEMPELPRPDVSNNRAADWLDLTPGLSDSQESMRRLANTPAPPEGTAWMMPTRSNLRGRHPRWHLTRYGWNEFTETSIWEHPRIEDDPEDLRGNLAAPYDYEFLSINDMSINLPALHCLKADYATDIDATFDDKVSCATPHPWWRLSTISTTNRDNSYRGTDTYIAGHTHTDERERTHDEAKHRLYYPIQETPYTDGSPYPATTDLPQ